MGTKMVVSSFLMVAVALMSAGVRCQEELEMILRVDPPVIIENVTEEVTVDCRLDPSFEKNNKILIMSLTKNEVPLASVLGMKETDDDRMSWKGHMKYYDGQPNSFVTVSVKDPTYSEEGVYTCKTLYFNTTTYKEDLVSASVNLTVEEPPPPMELVVPEIKVDTEAEVVGCNCDGVWDEIKSLKETLVLQNQVLKEELQKYNESCRVSFSAKMTQDAMLWSDAMLQFDDVISNKGEAFNSKKSTFVAPCPGQYYFSLTLRSRQDMDSGSVNGVILVDGKNVAHTSVFGHHPTINDRSATNGAVLTLSQGQKVSVKVETTSSGKLEGGTNSIFSGFYLYP